MALTIFVFTKEEPKSVIHILWAGRLKITEFQRHFCSQCGHNVLSWKSIYDWIEMFKKSWSSV